MGEEGSRETSTTSAAICEEPPNLDTPPSPESQLLNSCLISPSRTKPTTTPALTISQRLLDEVQPYATEKCRRQRHYIRECVCTSPPQLAARLSILESTTLSLLESSCCKLSPNRLVYPSTRPIDNNHTTGTATHRNHRPGIQQRQSDLQFCRHQHGYRRGLNAATSTISDVEVTWQDISFLLTH